MSSEVPSLSNYLLSSMGSHVAFKERLSYEQRVREVEKARKHRPGYIPIIIERSLHEKHLGVLGRDKFLVSDKMQVSDLIVILRRRLQLDASQALFLLSNGRNLLANGSTWWDIYRSDVDLDGFLYVVYASQETFG